MLKLLQTYLVRIPSYSSESFNKYETGVEQRRRNVPSNENMIINKAEIWATLRLPTFVKATRPAFSLNDQSEIKVNLLRLCNAGRKMRIVFRKRLWILCYTEMVEPVTEPKMAFNKIPTPWFRGRVEDIISVRKQNIYKNGWFSWNGKKSFYSYQPSAATTNDRRWHRSCTAIPCYSNKRACGLQYQKQMSEIQIAWCWWYMVFL